jgi:hypothetical protein
VDWGYFLNRKQADGTWNVPATVASRRTAHGMCLLLFRRYLLLHSHFLASTSYRLISFDISAASFFANSSSLHFHRMASQMFAKLIPF